MDVYKTLHTEETEVVPQGMCVSAMFVCVCCYSFVSIEMFSKREHVVARLQELEERLDPIVQLFEDPEVAEHMKKEDTSLFDYLAQNHEVCHYTH